MKTLQYISTLFALSLTASHALPVPSDGSDGNFSPTTNIEVDLSQAITGTWDQNNTANIGKGVYDPAKWAIVFKYSEVNIPKGVTVTFKNHPANPPVVWLVSGNVTIAGTVSLDGRNSLNDAIGKLNPTLAGPGGFRGAADGPTGSGPGYGPGGAESDYNGGNGRYNGSYGNPQILPLIGGSGGGAGETVEGAGAGGGGAILIAAGGAIQHTGTLRANGGSTTRGGSYGPGSGSGGAIRLIADTVTGSGSVSALAGDNLTGSTGRIRIETSNLAPAITINPNTIAVAPASPPILWPADNAPSTRIVSIDGIATPLDPTAPLTTSSDVGIAKNGNVDVIIETKNFPTSGNVRLRVGPKYGNFSLVNATLISGGNFTAASWKATLTFNPGFSALQVIATVP